MLFSHQRMGECLPEKPHDAWGGRGLGKAGDEVHTWASHPCTGLHRRWWQLRQGHVENGAPLAVSMSRARSSGAYAMYKACPSLVDHDLRGRSLGAEAELRFGRGKVQVPV